MNVIQVFSTLSNKLWALEVAPRRIRIEAKLTDDTRDTRLLSSRFLVTRSSNRSLSSASKFHNFGASILPVNCLLSVNKWSGIFFEFRRGTFLLASKEEDEDDDDDDDDDDDEEEEEDVEKVEEIGEEMLVCRVSDTEVEKSKYWGWSNVMASSARPREHSDSQMYVTARNLKKEKIGKESEYRRERR